VTYLEIYNEELSDLLYDPMVSTLSSHRHTRNLAHLTGDAVVQDFSVFIFFNLCSMIL